MDWFLSYCERNPQQRRTVLAIRSVEHLMRLKSREGEPRRPSLDCAMIIVDGL
jgi:hypothetical protein